MAAKKRNSPSRGTGNGQRHGVSGDPRRREPATRELAYRMAGGVDPAPWWPGSHERVLAAARAATWPDRRVELEDLTCRVVGDELCDRLGRHGDGHHPAQWLAALSGAAGAALRSALAADGAPDGGGDASDGEWRGLWSLLCGIALIAPPAGDDPREGTNLLARRLFPEIKDPRTAALAEAAQVTAGLGTTDVPPQGCRVTGPPLVARDDYGSRFLLAAPFAYGTEEAHWYAWDIDACWLDAVVGAGTFESLDAALAEWRDAVGPAASGAAPEECPPGLAARLLRQSLRADAFADSVRGDEPRELLREHFRQRRRARELFASLGDLPADAGAFMVDMDQAREEFLRWYAARHGAAPEGTAEAVDTITDQWGPHKDIDDRGFYACSPHRVELAARLIRNGDYGEHATLAIRLLPDWTRWCAERGGVAADAAERALEAAASATALADATAAVPDYPYALASRRPE